ncbi:hypothetical protein BDF20DRAFT_94665 [Mycotypha africana]|uniref:uncharacterized protein n=1 Tax=Mycotypha africana TaxID=64632 RepID=UPI002300DD93|nr:uncharacterized protein BDF20DRAFT_94665 [Mycotypha africana]KAI8969926.1 hypothetical protein BDF20DRAFT_94665 [Mycotypha africana]
MEINYISIYDNTAQAKFLFVSESVTEVLGFRPQELIGEDGYDLTHPDERDALSLIHSVNVKYERMSTITSYRSRHKDGHYVQLETVVHYCYDVLICTNFAIVSPDCVKHKMRQHSADEAFIIHPDGTLQIDGVAWNDTQDRIKKILIEKYPWDTTNNKVTHIKQEPRFCLFINRYTIKSTIVFATEMIESMVGGSQVDCIGESLYNYIAPKDRENVMKLIEVSKSTDMINRIRFDWLKSDGTSVPLEAVVSCTYDGLVMVARVSTSFITINTST